MYMVTYTTQNDFKIKEYRKPNDSIFSIQFFIRNTAYFDLSWVWFGVVYPIGTLKYAK